MRAACHIHAPNPSLWVAHPAPHTPTTPLLSVSQGENASMPSIPSGPCGIGTHACLARVCGPHRPPACLPASSPHPKPPPATGTPLASAARTPRSAPPPTLRQRHAVCGLRAVHVLLLLPRLRPRHDAGVPRRWAAAGNNRDRWLAAPTQARRWCCCCGGAHGDGGESHPWCFAGACVVLVCC